VHRDIKPENIFVTTAGEVKVLDFSLAKNAEELGDDTSDDKGTHLGAMTLFGTPEYMAPEQIAGGAVDHRSDVYAIGCVLYELLSGRLPFAADSAVKILDAKLKGSPESIRERAPALDVPAGVSRLVLRALARHPARRFDSARALADALAIALHEPTRRKNRRRAAGAAVFAAVMAFALVLVGREAKPWLEALPNELPWLEPAAPSGADSPAQGETPIEERSAEPGPEREPAREPDAPPVEARRAERP
jgi:serine/threonine-protein kinase